jgi:hypothetical protein
MLSLSPSPSGHGAVRPHLRQMRFDPRTLPLHLRQFPTASGPGGSPRPNVESAPSLPLWTYHVTASPDLGGGNYSGIIVGRDPHNHAKVKTKLPTQIVPLIITIDNGGGDVHTYDPTAPDNCNSASAVTITTQSPLFNNNSWTMNGVNVGDTQYIDAHQRAQFWSLVAGTNYHLILKPSALPAQTLTFGSNGTSGAGENLDFSRFGFCEPLGEVFIDDLDAAVQGLITGPLAGMINPGTFPIFAMVNVVSGTTNPPDLDHCCILGYHSAFINGGNLQIYSPYDMDTAGFFGSGFTSALSHELAEAVNDPAGNNLTPVWGNIGQTVGFCQNNFENGDPLSPGFGTPSNPFFVTQNGRRYALQELVFFNWFFGPNGGNPLGVGGLYSNNGTFQGDNIPCPPGGTN